MRQFAVVCVVLLTVCLTGSAGFAAIVLDYTHDSFFAGNATARAALEAAAQDVSDVLNFSGTALNGSHDMISGVNGGSTAIYNFNVNYTNPTTGAAVSLGSIGDLSGGGLAAEEIRVFVGVRPLAGSVLGQGGPGGFGFGAGLSGPLVDRPGAVAAANANASAAYGRGDGPVMGELTGSLDGNPVSVSTGVTVGNLWFDSDTNNDFITDFDAWHFDHTTAVAAGRNDFYSVALHEILHAVGVGTSESWNLLTSGTTWTGANAIALHGTGVGLINGSGDHIAAGIMSTSIVDGMAQEVVMDPNITVGTRKFLTDLDIAFLQDIGFSNASSSSAVPEPGSLAVCLLGTAGFLARRRRRRRGTTEAESVA